MTIPEFWAQFLSFLGTLRFLIIRPVSPGCKVDGSLGQDTSRGLRTWTDTWGANEDNQLHPTPGLHPATQAYHVFNRSRNQYTLNCLHLVPLSLQGHLCNTAAVPCRLVLLVVQHSGTGWLCLLALSGLGRRWAQFRWFLLWLWCALGSWLLVFWYW